MPRNTGRSILLGADEAAAATPEARSVNFPILIVEDDYLIALGLEAALLDAGFTVIGVAASADEDISLAAAHRPSLVIMDIRLSGKRDGIDAALELYQEHAIEGFGVLASERDGTASPGSHATRSSRFFSGAASRPCSRYSPRSRRSLPTATCALADAPTASGQRASHPLIVVCAAGWAAAAARFVARKSVRRGDAIVARRKVRPQCPLFLRHGNNCAGSQNVPYGSPGHSLAKSFSAYKGNPS
jgi:CheY-like chemotaxis protein